MPIIKLTFFASFLCLLFLSCKVTEVQNAPSVSTNKATDIKIKSVILNGEVTNDGFSPTIERGFVFSDKNSNPTTNDNKLIVGNGKGPFSALLNNLSVATKYYFRAFAINSIGTSLGSVESFATTDYELPSVQIELPTNITYSTVELNGIVINNGGGNISESGFVLSINPIPKTTDMKFPILKNGLSQIKYTVEKLNFNTKYYVRVYAINEKGTAYSNELNFVTLDFPYLKNTTIVDVKSTTGRIWMDRNLGALRAAVSINDELSFGHLFQWGRLADGHESRISQTTRSISNKYIPGTSLFILNTVMDGDWLIPQNNYLWSNDLNNNPCPIGYSIPTEEEIANEIKSWNTQDAYGAFNSSLKLPFAGFRNGETGLLELGFSSAYWTKTTVPKNTGSNYSTSKFLGLQLTSLNFFGGSRAYGFSCRCIKNL